MFYGRCYFSEIYFAASHIFLVKLAICHTAVTTGGTALSKLEQTCQNPCACQAYCTDAMFKGYDPSLNPPVWKQHWLHVSSAFVTKPPNCGKNSEFCYILESRPKFMKEVPKGHYPSELSQSQPELGEKKLWVNARFHTGSVGNWCFEKISLQSQVKFSGFCDTSQRMSGCLWTWNSKQNPAAANLNTARQRLRKKCLHELLGRIHRVSPADIWKSKTLLTLLLNS